MILVEVKLKSAITGKITSLGTAYIYNDATGTGTSGNYVVKLSKRGKPNQIWKEGSVKGFPRKRLLMWDLLYRALKDVVGHRNDTE